MTVPLLRDDRGSASIWLLGVGLAVVVLAGGLAVAAGSLVASHRAQAAADLGALAGARDAIAGEQAACARAGGVVAANAARMVGCRLVGLDLTVTAEVARSGPGPGIRASARAGPARATANQASGHSASRWRRDSGTRAEILEL
ncbi:MAG TPA: Rv3654c family TadE-like protein [Micromonosporaceae bacterium]|nr:Rv3654c family TadE-like protein [Micromonosporaceae bacterium]